jgi:hypothetical protein
VDDLRQAHQLRLGVEPGGGLFGRDAAVGAAEAVVVEQTRRDALEVEAFE